MKFEEITVLKILALGLDDSTPDHRLEYLLRKLYGLDGFILDYKNLEFFERINAIALRLK